MVRESFNNKLLKNYNSATRKPRDKINQKSKRILMVAGELGRSENYFFEKKQTQKSRKGII